MEHNVLFRTIHGSRLYGLHHEDSDYDYYTVVETVSKKKAKYATHSIVDGLDSVVVDFGTWVHLCQKGVPQALEAMFSTKAEVDRLVEFRRNFYVGTTVLPTYLRTIKSMKHDDFKRKRHALRLAFNMRDIRKWGRFNPTLTPAQVELLNVLAENLSMEQVYDDALAIAWS